MQYIDLGSCFTVPAGVEFNNSPIAMQRRLALSVKVLDSMLSIPSPAPLHAVHAPCLFYLSPFCYLGLTSGS